MQDKELGFMPEEGEEYSADIITLSDENGDEYQFEIIDSIEYNEERYMAVVEMFDDSQKALEAEPVLIIFRVGEPDEDGLDTFDVVDDDVLQMSEITDDGYMCIGSAKYKHIIIPEDAFIPEATRIELDKFIKRGGYVSHELSNLTPVVKADGKGLRAMHRKLENGDILILFRETGDNEDYCIHLPSENGYLLDLTNGELQHIETENGVLKISLAIGETAVVLLTDDVLKAENQRQESLSPSLCCAPSVWRAVPPSLCCPSLNRCGR